jgi:ribosomal protein S27E
MARLGQVRSYGHSKRHALHGCLHSCRVYSSARVAVDNDTCCSLIDRSAGGLLIIRNALNARVSIQQEEPSQSDIFSKVC